ncbi:MAG: YeeE/YedE family protein [Myxococcota bacterium]
MIEASYLPWWTGGLILGGVALLHLALTGRLISVSGIFSRGMRWTEDERERKDELALENGDLDQALLEATLAQFGADAAETLKSEAQETATTPCGASPKVRLPIIAGALFLGGLVVGGAVSAVLATGGIHFAWSLGEGHASFLPSPAMQIAFPALGGMLVGFGARMAGGCTSSHGLIGCARLQPGSIVAIMAVFAGGGATALLMRSWV